MRRLTTTALLALGAMLALIQPSQAQMRESRSAVWTQVAVVSGQTNLWYTLYQVSVSDVRQGEEFMVSAEAQLRNDLGHPVELVSGVFATYDKVLPSSSLDSAYAFEGLSSPINGWNITPDAHYGVPRRAVVWRAARDAAFVSFAFRVRARSSLDNGSRNLTVNTGQGAIQVKRLP